MGKLCHKERGLVKAAKIFIDSQITNARSIGLTKEQVAYIKEGKRTRRRNLPKMVKDSYTK